MAKLIYSPRLWAKSSGLHNKDFPWNKIYLVAHRRCGKSYALTAETVRRAYNNPLPAPKYLFISPLAEQTESNIQYMVEDIARVQNDDGSITSLIQKYDKQTKTFTLINGATVTFGGARTAEKFRGLYLDGCVFDEYSQIPDNIYSEVIFYALQDRKGWVAFAGTARTDDDYKLYKGFKASLTDPDTLSIIMGCHQSNVFDQPTLDSMRDTHKKFCIGAGMSQAQEQQSWLCEMECDFSFIDEGRPNMSALFYPELSALFNKGLMPANDATSATTGIPKTAVFDIGHSTGRDFTVGVIYAETTLKPANIVIHVEWENNKRLDYWFDVLRRFGVRDVALPFDAGAVNKETMLSTKQIFRRAGFNVLSFRRLAEAEQTECARWLLSNATFSDAVTPALSECGKFVHTEVKHNLDQDIVSAFKYTGQVMQKKHIRREAAQQTPKEPSLNEYSGVSMYSGVGKPDF